MKTAHVPHVLYVEDDDDSRTMMRTLLSCSDIDVTCVRGASEARVAAAKTRFDVFIIETKMHDGDGVELCRSFRKSHKHIPVVIYSGFAYEKDRAYGLKAGASAYLVKPYSDLVVPTVLRLTQPQGGLTNRRYFEISFNSIVH